MNPDRLAELEEERKFLLKSIRDLEQEYSVGDIDTHDLTALRDGYVARAAAVLREIDDGRTALRAVPRRPWYRTLAIVGVTLVVAIAVGLFVANSAGQRLPGQSLTGGQDADQVALLLAEGNRLLGTDSAAAIEAYDKVLAIEPNNAEAATYKAYLQVIDGKQAGDQAAVQAGVEALRAAATLDETYGDPHCLLAVAGGNFLDPADPDLVLSEGAKCLDMNPPAALLSQIKALIARYDGSTPTTELSDDVPTLLTQAEAAQADGDYATALTLYQRVLTIDATNLTALSYSGYLIALNGNATGSVSQVNDGLELMLKVTTEHPEYSDAHCLLSLASHYFAPNEDLQLTIDEGETCLSLDPPADVIEFVQTVIAQAKADQNG
jgi:tetratricopeptide (TPR) repeat protein